MAYYTATIARDGDARRQIAVHWDDNNPNRHIIAPVTVATDELDEEKLSHVLASMGFRIISGDSDNVGRGWAVVSRAKSAHLFFNPLDGTWRSHLSDETKEQIRTTYPGAAVPGAEL